MSSVPSLTEFNPSLIPFQYNVIKDIRKNFDYSKGVHEVLLSGSVGCLRADTLIETASGLVPICDITQQDYVLSYDHQNNRFVYQQGSDAFPKGKDFLYRVTHEHGEFVATANHHIYAFDGIYQPVSSLSVGDVVPSLPLSLQKKHPSCDQRSSLSDVLRCWHTVSSYLYHCVEHIHQGGPQLQADLNIVLSAFPLQDDAQVFGQFSYCCKPAHMDDLRELGQELDRIFEVSAHQSMRDFLRLLENKPSGEEGACTQACSTTLLHSLRDNLQSLLYRMHDDHPRVLLSFLYRICNSFNKLLLDSPDVSHITNSTILSIEKLGDDEWYWDLKVPNTNNYVSCGIIHHNSAKSLLMSHLAVTHAMMFPKSNVLLGRRSLPSLKDTLYAMIKDHIGNDLDYGCNDTRGIITLPNGSNIFCYSWADKKYKKVRSYALSAAFLEEITENDDMEFYKEIRMRLNRLPHVPEKILVCATNPDSPAHWAYEYFISKESKTRRTYYSVTEDNPFLDKTYIQQLKETLTERECRRMLFGEWIEIMGEVIYYAFDQDASVIDSYTPDPRYPIVISYDFNIGNGKPMSAVLFQYIAGIFYIFDECIIHGARTLDTIDDMEARGLLNTNFRYIIHGDAAGRARSTNYNKTDYDVISKQLATYDFVFEIDVPLSNPPVRKRHIILNGLLKNSIGETKIKIVKGSCPTLIKGLRLTKLKDGASYIEDDSKEFQHVTTALGYGVMRQLKRHEQTNNFRMVKI